MGGAFCAVANDFNAIDYNTAGLAQLSDRIQVMLSHNEWIEGVRSEYLGFVLPVGEVSSLGMSLHYFYVDGLIERDILGDESGRTFGAKDGAVTTAFGTRIAENVSVGGSVKVISESVYDKSSIAASADLGCLVSFDRFSVGAALQNIGTPLQLADDSFPLPFRARAGASYACSDNLLVAADLCQNFPGRSEVKAGAEYSLGQMVFLRAGYRFNQYENTGPGVSAGRHDLIFQTKSPVDQGFFFFCLISYIYFTINLLSLFFLKYFRSVL
jgi:opacity protein-like surface antigen